MINYEDLTTEEKIGQLFLIKLKEYPISEKTKEMILKYKIGGFILYSKDFNNYKEMLDLVNDLKNINRENKVPLFIAIDQEGGRVDRFPREFKNVKSAKKVAKCNDLDLLEEYTSITCKMLKETGFNMNFAPVLDVQHFEDKHAIGDRCYGTTVEEVIKYAIPVMKKFQEEKIISVIKHFPGHGSTQKDSHIMLPIVKKDLNELKKEELIPYEEAFKNGADALLVGHLLVKELDKYPASLSYEIINNLLREEYKFDGLVVTDDLEMMAVSLLYGLQNATKMSLKAGADLIMISCSYKKISSIIKNLMVNFNDFNLEEKVNRILKIKEKYFFSDENVQGCDVNKINEELEKLNEVIESHNLHQAL